MRSPNPRRKERGPTSGQATLSAGHGHVVMPTETGYDREIFDELVRHAARSREHLELRVGSCTWTVGIRDGILSATCQRCGTKVDSLDRVLRH